MFDKETRDIEAYVLGHLPQTRKEQFDEKFNTDPEFRKKVNELRPVFLGLNDLKDEAELRNRLKEVLGSSMEIVQEPEKGKVVKWKKRFAISGLAASLLIYLGILGVRYDTFKANDDQIFSEKFQSISTTKGSEIDNCPSSEVIQMFRVEKPDYKNLLMLLNGQKSSCSSFYIGLAHLGVGDSKRASSYLKLGMNDKSKYIKENAQWYYVLALVKTDRGEAINVLKKQILTNPDHQAYLLGEDLLLKLENNKFSYKPF